MSGPAVTVLDAQPVVDAVKTALDELAASDHVTTYVGEGPKDPTTAGAYIVMYVSPGQVGGYPFDPGVSLIGTITLHGFGTSERQAFAAATKGRSRLLAGDIDVDDLRLSIVPDDATPPYPERDDSTKPGVYVQPLVFDYQLD
jgi:hypothetical protein